MENNKKTRLRGFNLVDMLYADTSKNYWMKENERYPEKDFKMISEWGFNYVRLPLSYRIWSSASDPFTIDAEKLRPLDKALEYSQKYGLHATICLHRVPGFCVNDDEPEREPFDLWNDREALEASKFQYTYLAERYKNISDGISFNILNEPPYTVRPTKAAGIMDSVVTAIRNVSPERTVMIDGYNGGNMPPLESMLFKTENCIYSCRGYKPGNITHWGIGDRTGDKAPHWPEDGVDSMCGKVFKYGREEMEETFAMWRGVADALKADIFCGEFGCNRYTPHDVMLKLLDDLLSVFKKNDIGFAIWNFKSPNFGMINNTRSDAKMKNINGYSVDTDLLELLQKY